MKKLLILMIIGLLSSCNMETSNNGDLDGLWQATFKENIVTGSLIDLRDFNASWSFQGGLVQMNASTIPSHVIGKFVRTDNFLKVNTLCIFRHGKGDEQITDVSVLEVFGFIQLDETFEVLELNEDVLRLQNSRVRLSFRKY